MALICGIEKASVNAEPAAASGGADAVVAGGDVGASSLVVALFVLESTSSVFSVVLTAGVCESLADTADLLRFRSLRRRPDSTMLDDVVVVVAAAATPLAIVCGVDSSVSHVGHVNPVSSERNYGMFPSMACIVVSITSQSGAGYRYPIWLQMCACWLATTSDSLTKKISPLMFSVFTTTITILKKSSVSFFVSPVDNNRSILVPVHDTIESN
jgi:hypothetical protein